MAKKSNKSTIPPVAGTNKGRLLAVDILRGIAIACMLLVNNPGSWGSLYRPLAHAEWIGLTPTDLVFPSFVFVMGVAMYFSLRKFDFKPSRQLLWKVVRRTVVLFLIGWAVQWFGMALRGIYNPESDFLHDMFGRLRILGVFQRLALVYFFGSLTVVLFKQKFIPWIIGLILVVYAIILGTGHGYDFSVDNIIAQIDLNWLGEEHMYHESAFGERIAFDPEGILSTLPCIAHVLIGFMVGAMLTGNRDNNVRYARCLLWGATMLLSGSLLQYGIPCGKKMWSTTFVLITCGMASCVLGLLIYFIDVRGHRRWCRFFESFGVNPLFCYLVGTILSIVFGTLRFGESDSGTPITIHNMLTEATDWLTLSPEASSCLYAIIFVLITWAIGYQLYRKKIYIKI